MAERSIVTDGRSWFADEDRTARTMTVTPHATDGVVAISLWDGRRCVATHRVPTVDVPDLISALAQSLAGSIGAPVRAVPPPPPPPAPRPWDSSIARLRAWWHPRPPPPHLRSVD